MTLAVAVGDTAALAPTPSSTIGPVLSYRTKYNEGTRRNFVTKRLTTGSFRPKDIALTMKASKVFDPVVWALIALITTVF